MEKYRKADYRINPVSRDRQLKIIKDNNLPYKYVSEAYEKIYLNKLWSMRTLGSFFEVSSQTIAKILGILKTKKRKGKITQKDLDGVDLTYDVCDQCLAFYEDLIVNAKKITIREEFSSILKAEGVQKTGQKCHSVNQCLEYLYRIKKISAFKLEKFFKVSRFSIVVSLKKMGIEIRKRGGCNKRSLTDKKERFIIEKVEEWRIWLKEDRIKRKKWRDRVKKMNLSGEKAVYKNPKPDEIFSAIDLAEKFNVTEQTIYRVIKNKKEKAVV